MNTSRVPNLQKKTFLGLDFRDDSLKILYLVAFGNNIPKIRKI